MAGEIKSSKCAINATASPGMKSRSKIEQPVTKDIPPLTHGDSYFVPARRVIADAAGDCRVLTFCGGPASVIAGWPSVISVKGPPWLNNLALETKFQDSKKDHVFLSLGDIPVPQLRVLTDEQMKVFVECLSKKVVTLTFGQRSDHGRVLNYLVGTHQADVAAATGLFLATRAREQSTGHVLPRQARRIFALSTVRVLKDLAVLGAGACLTGATLGTHLGLAVMPIVDPDNLTGREGAVAQVLSHSIADLLMAREGDDESKVEYLIALVGKDFVDQGLTPEQRIKHAPACAGARVGIVLSAAFIAAEKEKESVEKKKAYASLGFLAAKKLIESVPFAAAATLVLEVGEIALDYYISSKTSDVGRAALASFAQLVSIPAEKINAQAVQHKTADKWGTEELATFFRWAKHTANANGFAA